MTIRDTDADWIHISGKEPFWGVLSSDNYKTVAMDSLAFSKFMMTGHAYVDDLLGFIHAHLDQTFTPRRALDFGCGVGRIIIPLSNRVDEAVGVDIAPAMLELTRSNAGQAGVKNLVLVLSDDELSLVPGKFDFIVSHIVLQHIPPDRGYRLIESLIHKLEVGGIASIQVTYAKARKHLTHEGPKALYYRRVGSTIVDVLTTALAPPTGTVMMYDYDLNELVALICLFARHPLILLPTTDDDHLGVQIIFQKV